MISDDQILVLEFYCVVMVRSMIEDHVHYVLELFADRMFAMDWLDNLFDFEELTDQLQFSSVSKQEFENDVEHFRLVESEF